MKEPTIEALMNELAELRQRDAQREASLEECALANEKLQNSKDQYRLMVQGCNDYGIFMLDPDGRIVNWNRGAQLLKGYTPDEVIGRHFAIFRPEEDVKARNCEMLLKLAIEKGSAQDEGWRIRKDGTRFWADVVVTALRDEAGKLTGFLKVTRDRTARKQMDDQLKASLREKELLLREIHHRVRNNLQAMSSLLRLQSRYSQDPAIGRALKDSESRIRAMALVHQKLYESGNLAKVMMKGFIGSLAKDLFQSYGDSRTRIELNLEVEELSFDVDLATLLGLIICELLSNSIKHAFPGRREGKINVSLAEVERAVFQLTVEDDGIGIPPDLDISNPRSMGMELVSTLVDQLHGGVELDRSHGTKVRVEFKPKSAE